MIPGILLLFGAFAQISVLTPATLKSALQALNPGQSELRSSLSNFGNPPYGSSILGPVLLPKDPFACRTDLQLPGLEPGIALLLRGECEFAQKVRNAEKAGATAVLVIDNKEELVETVIMGDRSQGNEIAIPSFLIAKRDGELLKSYVEKGEVVLKLHFEVRRSEYVVMELWYSANEWKTRKFVEEFEQFGRKFTKNLLELHPRIALWNCYECQEANFTLDKADCVSGGRYCAPDPDGSGPLSGRHVLMEDLRQLCVFQSTVREDSYGKWFSYLKVASELCASNLTEHCAAEAMAKTAVDREKVGKCVEESFYPGDPVYADNYLLGKELNAWKTLSPGFFPALLLNSVPYRGDWEGLAVAKALCASFSIHPAVCQDLNREEAIETEKPGQAVWAVIGVSAVLMCVAMIGYRGYMRRRVRKEVEKEVKEALRTYQGSEAELSSRAIAI